MRLALLSTSTIALVAMTSVASAGSFTFTNDADWDTGSYASTNSGPPGADNQVQLDPNIVTQFDFIWVAASGRDSAVLIDTTYDDATDGLVNDGVATLAESAAGSGAILGEYLTRPSGMAGNPSRTTVDLNGDVWIGNRNEAGGGKGSIVKITSNPDAGPTSSGVWNGSTFNRLDWSNASSADSLGGTSTATDVAIKQYIRTDSTNNRTIAIDANNNVWVGGLGNRKHNAYDTNGTKIGGTADAREGGYGGVIDGNGILWSSDWSANTIARYDTNAADPASSYIGSVFTGGPSYGLAVDGNGRIWNSHYSSNTISRIDPNGGGPGIPAVDFTVSSGGSHSRGVAVTTDNHIWVANSVSNTVTRLDNNGNLLATIPVGAYPTGVSVDSNGKVWVTNLSSNNVMRIDPAGGGGLGAVDLTVDLGSGANPYNYSDMTGSTVGGITNPTGTWLSGAIDGGLLGTMWDEIFWNTEAEGTIPTGSGIDVQVRVADTVAGLSGLGWTSYASGDALNLIGRYAQIKATLTRPGSQGALTPVFSDVTLTTKTDVIPLPATLWLLIGGVMTLFGIGRRRA